MVGMMERCDKAPMGLECIEKLGHAGKCSCIKTEAFNAAMQDAEDEFLWGGFKVVQNKHMPKDVIGIFGDKPSAETLKLLGYLAPSKFPRWECPATVDAQLEQDYLLYGCSYHTVDDQGRKVRIDPTKLVIRCRGVTAEMVEAAKGAKP